METKLNVVEAKVAGSMATGGSSGLTSADLLKQFSVESAAFDEGDVEVIKELGLYTWALTQGENIRFSDEVFDWRMYPILVRASLINDMASLMGIDFRYMLPFRRLGRVIVSALLPESLPQITVGRDTSPPPQIKVYRDPPIPAFVLGATTRDIDRYYFRNLVPMLRTGNRQGIEEKMAMMAGVIARLGTISKAEMFYFTSVLQSLINGSWRQLNEFGALQNLTYLIQESKSDNPAQSFKLAEKMLLDGQETRFLASAVDDDPDADHVQLRSKGR